MKKRNNLLYLFVVLSSMSIFSCKKEVADSHTCNSPEEPVDPRDKFEGNYVITDSIFHIDGSFYNYNESDTYVMNIFKDTIETNIIIYNLFNSGDSLYAPYAGNIFSIPNQLDPGGIGAGYIGNGHFEISSDSTEFFHVTDRMDYQRRGTGLKQ